MSNKYNSSNIQSITNKKIFLDANILIYLFGFGTPTSANWENQYATLYSKLNKQNNIFVVDYIVISEFVNRAIRIEYDNYLISNNLKVRIGLDLLEIEFYEDKDNKIQKEIVNLILDLT